MFGLFNNGITRKDIEEQRKFEDKMLLERNQVIIDYSNIIPKVYSKENKMTREKAERKVLIKLTSYVGGDARVIDILEALGLIKFEEKIDFY